MWNTQFSNAEGKKPLQIEVFGCGGELIKIKKNAHTNWTLMAARMNCIDGCGDSKNNWLFVRTYKVLACYKKQLYDRFFCFLVVTATTVFAIQFFFGAWRRHFFLSLFKATKNDRSFGIRVIENCTNMYKRNGRIKMCVCDDENY